MEECAIEGYSGAVLGVTLCTVLGFSREMGWVFLFMISMVCLNGRWKMRGVGGLRREIIIWVEDRYILHR